MIAQCWIRHFPAATPGLVYPMLLWSLSSRQQLHQYHWPQPSEGYQVPLQPQQPPTASIQQQRKVSPPLQQQEHRQEGAQSWSLTETMATFSCLCCMLLWMYGDSLYGPDVDADADVDADMHGRDIALAITQDTVAGTQTWYMETCL